MRLVLAWYSLANMLAPQIGSVVSADSMERVGLPSHPEAYVDANEGAAFLGIHAKTLMRLARERRVPAYSFSEGTRHHWRFLLSDLDQWMKKQGNLRADRALWQDKRKRRGK
jgi:excisionase family DNA binding protein